MKVVGATSTALRSALLVSSSRKEKRKGKREMWPRGEDKDALERRPRIADAWSRRWHGRAAWAPEAVNRGRKWFNET